MSEKV
ncbi:rCG43577 [Rattus norvegicus]